MNVDAAKNELLNFNTVEVNQIAVRLISKDFAWEYHIMPFDIKDDMVHIAMEHPEDIELIECIKLITKKEIVSYRASVEQILLAIKTYYEKDIENKSLKDIKEIYKANMSISKESFGDLKDIKDAPAVKLTEFMITQALIKGSSDIHIEPQQDKVTIRYRIDGCLFDIFNLPQELYNLISTRIKIMADMDISEKRLPQDGKVNYIVHNESYDLRISTLPTIYGEKIVIRILYKAKELTKINSLNFNIEEHKLITNSLKHNHGIILVTGPTGSGKTTTLYAMLNELKNREKNITTIEDPVEMRIEGINQVNVNIKAKVTFASGLRSILRQDPDIIMIGEIRDEETAAIAVRAAITGHLVLSTLHTNDSLGSIHRLTEMKVPRYLLADAIIAIVAQRLVRKICENCKIEYRPNEIEKKILGINSEEVLYKGKGCCKCNNSGYQGRCAVSEILYFSEKQKRMILKEEDDEALKSSFKENNCRLLYDNCIQMVKNGITTFDEFARLSNGQF
jgi:type IV pilus assembly protein PilB